VLQQKKSQKQKANDSDEEVKKNELNLEKK
jgi:hypothetical protein